MIQTRARNISLAVHKSAQQVGPGQRGSNGARLEKPRGHQDQYWERHRRPTLQHGTVFGLLRYESTHDVKEEKGKHTRPEKQLESVSGSRLLDLHLE